MPPKRTIIVDPDHILRSIPGAVLDRIAELEAEIAKSHRTGWPRYLLSRTREGWIPYSLETFSGRGDLSESEKQRWRQAVRELEREGLVEIYGQKATEIRLTPKGRQRLGEMVSAL